MLDASLFPKERALEQGDNKYWETEKGGQRDILAAK